MGITRAFGIGLSGHGRYRIITEVLLPCQTEIVNVVNYNCGEIQQQPRFKAQLRSLLPQMTLAFGANKSVLVTIDELKRQQQSSDATGNGGVGLMKLFKLTGVMKTEYCVAIRSSLRNDFAEGVRAVLVDKDQNRKWNPSKREVNQSEVEALFEPSSPNVEELSV
ncbi:hypothetical protein DVH24_017963 [Malus domestica]|uniref:3-hydroxyisobutyryl-CoA hydrolase n=1 Tax=Malus domestica TaxID=3750 RepID=A0A498KF34_MALDO|nr:hypothetical protein DVH24_017963 [Malus domestica]